MMRFLASIGEVLSGMYVETAHAVFYPGAEPCTYIGGFHCGTTTAGVETAVGNAMDSITQFLAVGGGGLAVLYTAVGGLQMLLSFGDEGKFTRGRTSITWALIGFGLVLGSQMIVNFIDDRAAVAVGGAPLLDLMASVVNTILMLMNVLFVIIIMAAGVKAVIGRGKPEEFSTAKRAIGYAIAGALIVNLARALSTAVFNIFG